MAKRYELSYALHEPHLPQDGATDYRGISGEQFHGNKTSQSSIDEACGVAQPHIGLLAVDLGGLDQAVDLGAGGSTLGVSLNSHALRSITNGFIARSAGLLSIGKKPAST